MPWIFICSYDRKPFYDTVVTVTLGRHHRRWLMKYVTAQQPQIMLTLLQQSATLYNIAFQTGVAQI